jgi:hypothetical protein
VVALAAAALLLVVAAIALHAAGRSALSEASRGGWIVRAIRSPLFVACAAVAAACAALLAVMGAMLVRVGACQRAGRGGEDGSAVLEFALVLPIALTIVLVMVQAALLMGGTLCVNYSAYCAARSAVVHIPADRSPSEPPNELLGEEQSGKHQRIRMAAVWPLVAVSSGSEDVPAGDDGGLIAAADRLFALYGHDTPGWIDDRIARKLSYARRYTSVEVAPPAEGTTYGENEDIHVTVRHTFCMSVPYAGWLLAKIAGGTELPIGDGEYGMEMEAVCTLTNEGVQDYVDRERFSTPGGG